MLLHSDPPAAAHAAGQIGMQRMIRLMLTFCALTCRRTVSALWQVFLQKQLQVREGKNKVLAA